MRTQKRNSNLSGAAKYRKRALLLERDGPQCHWCRTEFTNEIRPTFDHLIPFRQGGGDTLANLVLACYPCNNDRANAPHRFNEKISGSSCQVQ